MSKLGHHGEPKKYEEADEDKLLAALSPAELQELERELLDLDNNIPIGMRQRDQTTNSPMQPFDERGDENERLHVDDGVKSKKEQVRGRYSNRTTPHFLRFLI